MYQRMVTQMFRHLMGSIMDAYIDDMVIKSMEEHNHLKDLTEAFVILKDHQLKLNTTKCAFGVISGKFLRQLVTRQGIVANPKHIMAIRNLKSLRTTKEVQKLTSMTTSLNQFISQSYNKSTIPLKKYQIWVGAECETALQEFKKYLTKSLFLSTMDEGNLIYVYLTISKHAISSVLLR